MVNVFIKGKISNRDFLVDLLFRHLVAKVKSIPFNTSIVKYKTSIFHRKDLRVLVQIPHLTQARFKYPTPGHEGQSNARGLPGGECWSFELIGELLPLFYKYKASLRASFARASSSAIRIKYVPSSSRKEVKFVLIFQHYVQLSQYIKLPWGENRSKVRHHCFSFYNWTRHAIKLGVDYFEPAFWSCKN